MSSNQTILTTYQTEIGPLQTELSGITTFAENFQEKTEISVAQAYNQQIIDKQSACVSLHTRFTQARARTSGLPAGSTEASRVAELHRAAMEEIATAAEMLTDSRNANEMVIDELGGEIDA